jgi:hypothetical protein
MTLLAYYILQVNTDVSMNLDAISAGKYWPNADEEEKLAGHEKICKVWQKNPPDGHLSVFIRLPASK